MVWEERLRRRRLSSRAGLPAADWTFGPMYLHPLPCSSRHTLPHLSNRASSSSHPSTREAACRAATWLCSRACSPASTCRTEAAVDWLDWAVEGFGDQRRVAVLSESEEGVLSGHSRLGWEEAASRRPPDRLVAKGSWGDGAVVVCMAAATFGRANTLNNTIAHGNGANSASD